MIQGQCGLHIRVQFPQGIIETFLRKGDTDGTGLSIFVVCKQGVGIGLLICRLTVVQPYQRIGGRIVFRIQRDTFCGQAITLGDPFRILLRLCLESNVQQNVPAGFIGTQINNMSHIVCSTFDAGLQRSSGIGQFLFIESSGDLLVGAGRQDGIGSQAHIQYSAGGRIFSHCHHSQRICRFGSIVFTESKVHIAAPVIGHAHIQFQYMQRAPNLAGIDTQIYRSHFNTGDDTNVRCLYRTIGKRFPEDISGFLVFLDHDITAGTDDTKDIEIHISSQFQLGIPVEGESDPVDQIHSGNTNVCHSGIKSAQAGFHAGLGRHDLEETEACCDGQGHRRHLGHHKHAVINIGHTAAYAGKPENTYTIQVDTRHTTVGKAIKLVNGRHAGRSFLQAKGTFHVDHHQLCRTGNTKFPDTTVTVHGSRQNLQAQCTIQ